VSSPTTTVLSDGLDVVELFPPSRAMAPTLPADPPEPVSQTVATRSEYDALADLYSDANHLPFSSGVTWIDLKSPPIEVLRALSERQAATMIGPREDDDSRAEIEAPRQAVRDPRSGHGL